jgi:hypothetical protein
MSKKTHDQTLHTRQEKTQRPSWMGSEGQENVFWRSFNSRGTSLIHKPSALQFDTGIKHTEKYSYGVSSPIFATKTRIQIPYAFDITVNILQQRHSTRTNFNLFYLGLPPTYLPTHPPTCLSVCLSLFPSIHLWIYNPLSGFDHLFSFLVSRQDSLDGGSARRKAATYTQNNTNTE